MEKVEQPDVESSKPEALAPPAKNSTSGNAIVWHLLTIAIAGVVAFGAARYQVRGIEAELELRPRVIIADFARMGLSLSKQDDKEQARSIDAMKGQIDKLRDAGFVVLDSQAVIKAPDDVYVPDLVSDQAVGKSRASQQ